MNDNCRLNQSFTQNKDKKLKLVQAYCVDVMFITQSNNSLKNDFMQKMFCCMPETLTEMQFFTIWTNFPKLY